MGLFDKNGKGLLGGLFDFNGDGKTTWDEEYLAFKIFEECTKEDDTDDDFLSDDLDLFSSRPYSFRTDDKVKIGDTVVVPVGEDKKEMKGKVVSIGQYSRLGVPYPVEKTKMIIRKLEEDN